MWVKILWLNGSGKSRPARVLIQAKKNHPELEFVHQHGENLSAFADNFFDIVTATFVLHGMKGENGNASYLEKILSSAFLFIFFLFLRCRPGGSFKKVFCKRFRKKLLVSKIFYICSLKYYGQYQQHLVAYSFNSYFE